MEKFPEAAPAPACDSTSVSPAAGSSATIEMPIAEMTTPPPPPPPPAVQEMEIDESPSATAPAEHVPSAALSSPLPILRERNTNVCAKHEKPLPVKVPPRKIFGAAERYLSPTDTLVSPISKGLLAKNRRPMRMFMPPIPPKALENTFDCATS